MSGSTKTIIQTKGIKRNRLGEIVHLNYVSKLFQFCLYCCVGFLIAGAGVFDECAPYAAAFVGASGVGVLGFGSLIGTTIGYTFFYGFSNSAEYIAACVMIFTTAFVCQYSPVYRKKYFMPIVVTVMVGITIAFGTVSTIRDDIPFFLRLLFEVSTGGGLTYVFARLSKLNLSEQYTLQANDIFCIIFSISILFVPFYRYAVVSGINIGCVLGALVVMICTYCGGITYGCGTAAMIGVLFDISKTDGGMFTLLYTLCALICGVVKWKNRFSFGILFQIYYIISYALFFASRWHIEVLLEALFSFTTLVLIPAKWIRNIDYSLNVSSLDTVAQTGTYQAPILTELASVFSGLCKMIYEEEPESAEPDLLTVFDQAGERVCKRCCKQNLCWSNHYLDMLMILKDISPKVSLRGRLEPSDFPVYFRNYCEDHVLLTSEVNHELRRLADQRMMKRYMNDHSKILTTLFENFSDILIELSHAERTIGAWNTHYDDRLIKYFQKNGLNCVTDVSMTAQDRIRITITGRDVPKLLKRENWIDELSELCNTRLCASYAEKADCTLLLYQAEPFAVTMGIASKRKTGECVCGDQFTYFKTDTGIMYILLSDGLGTGAHAEHQSAFVIQYLERMLNSGVLPITALKILNTAMQIKDDDHWGYATVDLVSIDLFSGETGFYKYGAAPTYVLSNNDLITVSGEKLSAGLTIEIPSLPYEEKMTLSPEDVLIITSDGVSIEDEWSLKKRIREERNSMKSLARNILVNAQKNNSGNDDMTVITVRIDIRP